MQIIGKVFRQ